MRPCRMRRCASVVTVASIAWFAMAPAAGASLVPVSRAPSGATARAVEILAYWSAQSAADESAGLSDLAQNASAVTWLSPYWFTLNGDATLTSHEPDHTAVLSAAREVHVPVLALVNDGGGLSALLATPAGRARGVAAVLAMLTANPGIGGVVVDFEQLPASARGTLVAFLRLLKGGLPAGDLLGVAVMPKTSDPGVYSWQRLFNYRQIGSIADFVQIMTYDHHGPGNLPGPISPNDWVAQVAAFAATRIPAHKLLIGVPGYGYDWISGTTNAVTVTAVQAIALAARYGASPVFDPVSGEMHFTYWTAAGTRHTVWYESAAGVAQKLRIVQSLGLGGLALWTIGGEQPAFWTAARGIA